MIRPAAGVAFTLAEEGDQRSDLSARAAVSRVLGVSPSWATVRQVHGASVVEATGPGDGGEADAIFTLLPGLPVAVFTADCLGVVLVGHDGVGVAHAGWRGAEAGVVPELHEAMGAAGVEVTRAFVGPGIGPCCFEVGTEVSDRFDGFVARTSWGTRSVDLGSVIESQLAGVEVWRADRCTMHQPGHLSHRRTQTVDRMAALGWLMRESETPT